MPMQGEGESVCGLALNGFQVGTGAVSVLLMI
jgi:hypothetical protein